MGKASSLVRALLALLVVSVSTAAASPLLWNKLGSAAEVTNSAYGPNLAFYNSPGGLDIIGNPAYVPGVFGNAVTMGTGSYSLASREHTIVWNNLNQYLNPNRGTIEAWYKQNSSPVAFDHGVYRIFDGSYGLGSGIGLDAEIPDQVHPILGFGLDFGGTSCGVSANISAFNGQWIHVAGVWDRNGIASTNDAIRLYINGILVASSTANTWGTTVGPMADIAGGNDNNIANQFAIDNLKVFDTALTDFSDRFDESSVPEPGVALLGLLLAIPLRWRRA